jgi:phage terminase Nu1 subunit (DNA packaging protein)
MAEIPSYPIAVMAKLLDLSERHVRRLADEKVLKKPERNKGWEITNVTLYIRYLRERAYGKSLAGTDLHNEKLRLTKAQADRATLEVSEIEGHLIPAQLVQDTWTDFVANVRAKLLGMPSRIAHQVIALDTYAEAESLIKENVQDALLELSDNGIPTKYADRVEQHEESI